MVGGPGLENRVAAIFEKSAPVIILISILLTIVSGLALSPMPEFQTDLDAFAPDSDADAAVERMDEVMPPSPHRIYVHIEPTQEGANVLEIGAIQQLHTDLEAVNSLSSSNGDFISSHINAAQILQLALEQRGEDGRNISEFNNWEELLEAIIIDEECTDAIGEERAIATASFARSVMLHSDFDYEPICNWLANGKEGDPTPSASSTMWVIEIDGDLNVDDRLQKALQVRGLLEKKSQSEDSALDYGVVSDDLVTNDINESTLDNLLWLLILSIVVVVLVLALAFRSVMMVAAPLLGLSAALVWTYGIRALAGSEFSILEVAVAPVVLGLGIDYSIHLQRAYEKARETALSPAQAWVRSFSILRVALTLSVITTAFAFLANFLSPLPPLKSFGLTLALGVVSAFVASTVTVGALHVMVEKTTGISTRRSMELPGFTTLATEFQRRHTALILLAVAGLTLSSIVVSVGQLDTKFELTDFLGEEMEVIEVRNSMYDSYEVEALKSVDILIEPSSGMEALTGERDLLKELNRLDDDLTWTTNVVTPEGTSRPSYDGLYPILRDAIESDEEFGEMYNLGVYDGAVDVTGEFAEGDIASAVSYLLANDTIGDPIRGQTWGERTETYVALTDDGNALRYLKMRIDVTAGNSEESSGLANQFKEFESSLEEATGSRVHLSGDLILVHNVLSGLVISQVESTAFSLAVSLFVLVASVSYTHLTMPTKA